MTVCIILNNKKYGVAIADSRAVYDDNRLGDVANKLTILKTKNYGGAVVGAGDAQLVFSLLQKAKSVKSGSYEKLLKILRNYLFDVLENLRLQLLEADKKLNENTASILDNLEPINSEDLEQIYNSECLIAAYDFKRQRILKHRIYPELYIPDTTFESVIGSGKDAAELELLRLIPGVPISRLNLEEITFFAMCAYVRATQNVGVGGAPKVALIQEQGVSKLNKQKCITLANLVAAYSAEVVGRDYAEEQLKNIMKNIPNYASLGSKLNLNENTLRSLLIPLGSWISYNNNQRYKK